MLFLLGALVLDGHEGLPRLVLDYFMRRISIIQENPSRNRYKRVHDSW